MKYALFSIIAVLISCSNEHVEPKEIKDEIPESSTTLFFEGEQYVKVDEETYQREGERYSTILMVFPNGKVKSVEHQGSFHACGVLVDTSRYFDEKGTLIKQISHDHFMPDGAQGCHESVQDLKVTEYFSTGAVKAKKQFRMGYQDVQQKVGVWQEYDESGNLISTINFEKP